MLWEVEIRPAENQVDREGARVLAEIHALGLQSVREVRSARSFLIEGELEESTVQRVAAECFFCHGCFHCFPEYTVFRTKINNLLGKDYLGATLTPYRGWMGDDLAVKCTG